MTDKEIIQALEYCITNGYCMNCPYNNCTNKDIDKIAIDLINRQQSEIERLQKEANLVSMQFQDIQERQEESQAEIDKLNAENMLTMSERNAFRTSFYEILKQLKTAKSEAIKEFAERLKYIITLNNTNDGYLDYSVDYNCLIEDIDELVQEMVGENNGKM